MPTFAPRNEPRKKKEELDLKKQVLEDALFNNLAIELVTRKAENYKTGNILYNKAILHVIRDKEWQNKVHNLDKEKAIREMEIWEKKSVETVIEEIKTALKKK